MCPTAVVTTVSDGPETRTLTTHPISTILNTLTVTLPCHRCHYTAAPPCSGNSCAQTLPGVPSLTAIFSTYLSTIIRCAETVTNGPCPAHSTVLTTVTVPIAAMSYSAIETNPVTIAATSYNTIAFESSTLASSIRSSGSSIATYERAQPTPGSPTSNVTETASATIAGLVPFTGAAMNLIPEALLGFAGIVLAVGV